MKLNLLTILLILTLADTFGQNTQRGVFVNGNPLQDSVCEKIVTINGNLDTIMTGEAVIDNIKINGNCLDIFIAYGGGCGQVFCQLIWDGAIAESLPEQIYLNFKFEDFDTCKALLHEKVSFDISSFEKYAQGKGIKINIRNSKHSVLYKA